MNKVIACRNIFKSYFIDSNEIPVLFDVNMEINKGSFTAIIGPSGSGKSTLMNILGCLDTPTQGEYLLDGIPVQTLKQKELSMIRNKKIGFIFQSFNLLSRYSVFHNVELPLIYSGLDGKDRKKMVMEAIETVGLANRIKHRPNELSGGQKQRVAIARALVTKPAIIFADEPTGNLDSNTGREILEVFRTLVSCGNTLVVIVTHDLNVAKNAEKLINIVDGKIKED